MPAQPFWTYFWFQHTGAEEEEPQARPVFPFTAIVGQEQMKLALMLNIIDPKIGGVMVMGDRGTGKSTTVRALTDLLPQIKVGCQDLLSPFCQGNTLTSLTRVHGGFTLKKVAPLLVSTMIRVAC